MGLMTNYHCKLQCRYFVFIYRRILRTLVWQRWQPNDSGVTAVTTDSAVTAMSTLVQQRCSHHCKSSGNCLRCHSTVSCHHCHINVHIVTSALSPLLRLSQRCARFPCHSAVLDFVVTALCTSMSYCCGIPPVYTLNSTPDVSLL